MTRIALLGSVAAAVLVAGCDCGGSLSGRDAGLDGRIPDRDTAGLDVPGLDAPGRFDVPSSDAGPPPAEIVIIGPGAPADAATRFLDPTGAPAGPTLLYPLDQVLFPRNVYAPDVQWEPEGAAGDLYRIRLVGTPTSVIGYVAHSGAGFRHDWLVDPAAWRALATFDAGSNVTLSVDRWSAGTVHLGPTITVQIARGSIAGAVYYWTLGTFSGTEGRIVRVRQGTDVVPAVENFMPQPTAAPSGNRCAACHGLSRDGNRLAVALDDGTFGAVYDLTVDLTGADPPTIFRFDRPWFFAAFDPSGSRLVMTDSSQGTHLLNAFTGAEIMPTSGPLRSGTHPAWAPDASSLTMVINADDAWNPSTGDLATIPIPAFDTFGAAGLLHGGASLAGAPEGGMLDAYPSYSPDAAFVAFQHGTGTLASEGDARGALYLIRSSGGAPARMDRASFGETSYYPNFTPFITPDAAAGEVYWLLFYTLRDYGNELAGTRGTRRRQVWVAAVSTTGTGDPSFVPYWLPGQASQEENASAYWAPIACRINDATCSSSGQCCSGVCGGDGEMVCVPPPDCRREGETCSTAADCCDTSSECAGGVCLGTVF